MRLKNLFIVFLLFFGVSLFIAPSSYAQLQNWRFEMPVTISNNSGTTLSNYQTLIRVDTRTLINAGFMQTDGRDIRFASSCGGSLIDYCLESYINTDSTRIWIKIAWLAPYSSQTIFMYFGNPSASQGSTLALFDGPYSSTNNVMVSNTGGVSNSQRGFRFGANRDVLVTHFGKRTPNTTPRYVTLFDYITHGIIAQLQVTGGTSGVYNYNQLTEPIWLRNGRQYVMSVYQGTGDDYYFGVSTQVGQYLTYYDMRYSNNGNQNTFPTNSVNGYHYGTPDFLYYTRQTPVSPEPSSTAGLAADTNTPAPPANLTVIAGNQEANLTWRKNTEFDVDKYFVYMNTSNNKLGATLIDSTSQPDTNYTVVGLINGAPYYFWVVAADRFCDRNYSDFSNVAEIAPLGITGNEQTPKVFALYQNYPNPFNPVTDIKYDIPKESSVKLSVYDMIGREVAVLVNEIQKPGTYTAKWGSENMPSGVYIYKLTAGRFEKTMKMVMLK